MAVMDLGMVGRIVDIPVSTTSTMLDWDGSNIGTEEMVITVGMIRPTQNVNSSAVMNAYQPTIPVGAGAGGAVRPPYAIIDYGLDGLTNQIVIDAWPEQSVIIPAGFVRVRIYAQFAGTYFASVARSVGKPRTSAKLTIYSIASPTTFTVPPFVKEVMISRIRIVAPFTSGAMLYEWMRDVTPISAINVGALTETGVIRVPGNVTGLRVTNQEGVGQTFVVTWFMEP